MPAETLHTAHGASGDERDVAAKLKQQYEKAQFDADQKEAFGKFDVTAPDEGEHTYQSYLDQRPAEGAVRDGSGYRNAHTGTFASEQAYETQKGDTQGYYDQLGGIGDQEVYEAPNYEEMGVMQLAKEAAKARELGDKAEEAAIREALDTHLTIDALKNDSETPEAAQKRYETEVARYDALVDRFSSVDKAEAETPLSSTTTPKEEPAPTDVIESEVNNTAGGVSEETETEPETKVPEVSETFEALEETKTSEESGTSEEVFLNGEKVTLGEPFTSPDGKSHVYQATKEDGTVQWVSDAQLTRGSEASQAAAFAVDATGETTILDEVIKAESPKGPAFAVNSQGETEVLDDELRAQTEGLEPDPRIEEERKAKRWWEKARDGIRKRAGVAYWAAQFETYAASPVREKWSKWLEHDVDDSMSDEEKDKKRKKNRYIAIGAGLGVTAALVTGGILLGHAISSSSMDAAADAAGAGSGKGAGAGGGLGEGLKGLGDQETPSGVAGLPIIGEPGEALSIPEVDPSTLSFSVGSGEGGEALFNRLNIDPAKWYTNAQALASQFPQDFYAEGNDVRIAHTGSLSQGAQDFINSLR